MIFNFLRRFETALVKRPPPGKILYDPAIGVKIKKVPLEVPKYISFKSYTGNEILFSLKDCKKFQPGEISSALLELGLRKGAPKNYDWNDHPCIKIVLAHIKPKIAQYTCRVLTSLALALNRLNIKDEEIWSLLAKNILRTSTNIEPIGLGYTFDAFVGKADNEFFNSLVSLLKVHINFRFSLCHIS